MAQEANNVYIALAVLGIITVAVAAFTFLEVGSLKQAVANSDDAAVLAKLTQMEQRIAALEKGGSATETVAMKMYYSASDPFQMNVLAFFPQMQTNLRQQGIALELEDVSSREAQLVQQGVDGLPGLFLSDAEAAKSPEFAQQLVESGFIRLSNGYYAEAYSNQILNFRTIISNQSCAVGGTPVLTEFSDFECPYCKQILPSIKQLVSELNGTLAFQFKHFPLDSACNNQVGQSLHPNACAASVAAECARAQNKFDEYHDALFNATTLSDATYTSIAQSLNMDMNLFNACLATPTIQDIWVKADIREGAGYGVLGTPTFVVNCKHQFGASSFDELKQYTCTAAEGLCSPIEDQ